MPVFSFICKLLVSGFPHIGNKLPWQVTTPGSPFKKHGVACPASPPNGAMLSLRFPQNMLAKPAIVNYFTSDLSRHINNVAPIISYHNNPQESHPP